MKKTVFSFALLLCATHIYSQVLQSDNPQVQSALGGFAEGNPLANFFQKRSPAMDFLLQQIRDDDGIVTHYVGAEIGTAYEEVNFKPGQVYYSNELLGNVYYRLNAYNDEMEIKKTMTDEETTVALLQDVELSIVAPNKKLVWRTFMDEKDNRIKGYLTELKQGDHYIFYRRCLKKFTEAKPASNSMVNPLPSRFSDYWEYYFKPIDGDIIRELPIHKKKLSKLFEPKQQAKIHTYFKLNKPGIDNPLDIRNLFTFLDNLPDQ